MAARVHRWQLVLVAVLLAGCKKDVEPSYELDIPSWFPPMEIPSDNQLTQARIDLGRKLFYDYDLSVNSTVSCGTCHDSRFAFSGGRAVNPGVNGALGFRNAPTLTNIGYAPRLFHDGGVETLELQAQAPIFNEVEMSFTIAGFLERIKGNAEYERMFEEAYGREPDAYGISRSIACFERTMISGHSRFDQYEYEGDENALSEQELRGRELFFSSETKCSSCHEPPLFTNYAYENIGLYENYADSGRARITHLAEDRGKFKVPTLRNIDESAPYMHDGSLYTLEQVVEHFNSGGVGHPNQSEAVKPLNLSEQQKTDLVAFLKTLSDESFVSDPRLTRP